MRINSAPAWTALALVSSVVGRPDLIPRALQRRTDTPPLPPCPAYTPYTYVGCFKEVQPRTLGYNPRLDFDTLTIEKCTATCKSNGFRYAGLIYFGECACGTVLPPPAPESECNLPCKGDPSQTCGANQRFSVWQDPTYPAVDITTIASQYTSLGCYTEGTGDRALHYRQTQLDAATLTTEACLKACGEQYYPLAGTEFGGECWCGVTLQGGSVKAPEAECSMACTGAPGEICGGPNRLNLYQAPILKSTQPCGESPPPPATCTGTAYGYADGKSTTFIALGIGRNWGWVITGTPPISGTLYLGAGGNDRDKATIAGTFTIEKVGSNLVVTYTTNSGFSLAATHLYYGSSPPSRIAPGQFGNQHSLPAGTSTDTYTIPYSASRSTYILHAEIAHAC